VVNGVALTVKPDEIENISKVAGVKNIVPDELLQLDTDRSPQFLDATILWNYLGGQSKAGQAGHQVAISYQLSAISDRPSGGGLSAHLLTADG
jgi:hypothetical protein